MVGARTNRRLSKAARDLRRVSMRLRHICACLVLAGLAIVPFVAVVPAMAANTSQKWTVPDISRLPDDAWGRTVRLGRRLITNTASLIGPEVRDPKQRFAGNNLNCESCHLD